jgi:nitrogen regulatory protein PII
MSQHATKLVIITEKLLLKHVVRIIEGAGASGYTVIAATGKGSRNSDTSEHPSVSDTLEKIKIEVITLDESIARTIADKVAATYFDNFSGIIFIDKIEVLYAHTL